MAREIKARLQLLANKEKGISINDVSALLALVPPMPEKVTFRFLPEKFTMKDHTQSRSPVLDGTTPTITKKKAFISERSLPGKEEILDPTDGIWKMVSNATMLQVDGKDNAEPIQFPRDEGQITLFNNRASDVNQYSFLMLNPRNMGSVLYMKLKDQNGEDIEPAQQNALPELLMINEDVIQDSSIEDDANLGKALSLVSDTKDIEILLTVAKTLGYLGSDFEKPARQYLNLRAKESPREVISAFTNTDVIKIKSIISDAIDLGVIVEKEGVYSFSATGSKQLAKVVDGEISVARQAGLAKYFLSQSDVVLSDYARLEKEVKIAKKNAGLTAANTAQGPNPETVANKTGKNTGKAKANVPEPVMAGDGPDEDLLGEENF